MGWRVGKGVGIDAALLPSTHQPNPQDDHEGCRQVTTSDESTRARCLRVAGEYVSKDRASTYGDAEDNFSNIAKIWNAQGVRIDGRQLVASDVALLMIGMKAARLRFNPTHEDSWVDVAGYAACGMDVATRGTANVVPFKPRVHDVGGSEKGWVSDAACQYTDASVGRIGCAPHAGHTYGNGAYWCDGYI